MLNGTSMAYALILVVVISLSLLSVILFSSLDHRLSVDLHAQKALVDNVESAVTYYLGAGLIDDSLELDLFGKGRDTVRIDRYDWGLFPVISARAKRKGRSRSGAVMGGCRAIDQLSYSLVLADSNSPLSLTGGTRLNGPVRLPEAGVKRAHIGGLQYNGEKLVYGEIFESARKLPLISTDILVAAERASLLHEDWSYPGYDLEERIVAPFSEDETLYYADDPIHLADVHLSGRIRVVSATQIVVASSSSLHQVVLSAPEVIFRQGFEGECQVFSGHHISLEEGVELNYPSALVLVSDHEDAGVHLSANTSVQGAIVDLTPSNFDSLIDIEEGLVEGVIYASGRLQLKGDVNGAVYANELLLRTSASTYVNHLNSGRLDVGRINQEMLLPALFGVEAKHILEWLD